MKTMTKNRCSQTGLGRPECCCRKCCAELLRRYAPELAAKLNSNAQVGRR